MSKSIARKALELYAVEQVLNRQKLYVDNTTGFEIGNDLSLSEKLSISTRIKRFLGIEATRVYKIVDKDAKSLTVIPSTSKKGALIKDWSYLPRIVGNMIRFRRPKVSDC